MLLKNKLIFIVEDNTMNRVVFQISLRVHGAQVEFDRWGRNTLDKLKYLKPDLIILDLMLPSGLSGYDIFAEIRKDSTYDAIPIIAVSASEAAIAIPKTRRMKFSGFIAKPIDETRFPEQVAQILAGEQIWSAGERYSGNLTGKNSVKNQS